jgi:hypothetical protein
MLYGYLLTEQPCLQEDCAEPGRNRKQEVLVRHRDGRQLGREKDQEDDDDLYFTSQLTRRHTYGGGGGGPGYKKKWPIFLKKKKNSRLL